MRVKLESIQKLKLGRWFYCKYCYKSIRPQIGDGVVVCPNCDAGLAPLNDVLEAGSLSAWYDGIVRRFNEECAAERLERQSKA